MKEIFTSFNPLNPKLKFDPLEEFYVNIDIIRSRKECKCK